MLEVWVTKGGHPVPGAEVQVQFGGPPSGHIESLPDTDIDGFTAKTIATTFLVGESDITVRHRGESIQIKQRRG